MIFCSNETQLVCIFIFKTTWKSYFKNNAKIPGNLLKKPGKIMEISWNFVSPKKWEPCLKSSVATSSFWARLHVIILVGGTHLAGICQLVVGDNHWRPKFSHFRE